MAGTRRSTRQTATATPKYADPDSSVSGDEAPSRSAKKATRRKRVREDEDDVKDNDSSPPKKAAKTKAKPHPAKATPPSKKPTKSQQPKPTTNPTPFQATSLEPSSPSNRTPSGSQQIYWLLKAEPLPRYENGINVSFSIDDLAACTVPEPWTGVRNPLACKNMRAMRKGDLGFFYHSNAKPSGVVGILRVVEEAKVDETAFDEKDPYFDKRSVRGRERWWCVGVEFVRKFEEVVSLGVIKERAGRGGELEGMQLVTNSRLSVSRVRKGEWDFILGLAGEEGGDGGGEEKGEGSEKGAGAQEADGGDEAE